MRKLLFLCAVSLFAAVVLMHTATEREYVTVPQKLTWDEARNHCQICFKDLVSLTPQNIQIITQMLNSDHWIGLRKNSNSSRNATRNSTMESNMSWTRWANRDPLIFQNWHPGWPVFKSSFPKIECCSCSCTYPAKITATQTHIPTAFTNLNVTDFTVFTENTTDVIELLGETAENTSDTVSTTENNAAYSYHRDTTGSPCVATPAYERSPLQPPVVLETNEKYIEDSCVAMLTFGPWVEKSCLERLPFICYEDSFVDEINVTTLTSNSASLSWQRGPSDVSHYRMEVKGDGMDLKKNLTDMTDDLGNLTSGTLYSVQVFPVKCERDLNPQSTTLYTLPAKVKDLKVLKVTETTVSLSWAKPGGNWDFYRVEYQNRHMDEKTEGAEVENLIPGGCYTFSVITGIQQKSIWSEESSIAACTRPGKVSGLKVSEITRDSLFLHWTKPEGNFTGFRVTALNHNNMELFDENTSKDKFTKHVTGLPNGSKIYLFVTALANHTLEGNNETIAKYTAPGPISNLTVQTKHNSLTATWNPPTGDNLKYTVELWLDEKRFKEKNLTDTKLTFDSLASGSYYTVVVFALSGNSKSLRVNASEFTLPFPPTNLRVSSKTTCSITLEWTAPSNVIKPTFLVNMSSSFWDESHSEEVSGETYVKFDGLKSGSKYQFQVQTVAGKRKSEPRIHSESTDPDKMEISLSMICSTMEADACDPKYAADYVNGQLEKLFNDLLKGEVFWELKK